ncbi:ATPase [Paenibacillus sp. MMS18-CY102]|uniref:ATPase n=1 Tax=Paenibacillus sp. MMS18-CY102 TaxID=2682849 RepID=UPI001365A0FE|nr:ATPase [Paenibacillus sp. MMS18-CY102]MWC30688.1 ATPase [Paenibacillus sp. MMS18-CY102]
MLKLGEKVIIVDDRFEQNLPIGEYGYVIAYDRNADNVFEYVVRVPKAGRNFLVPGDDVEREEVLIKLEVDRIEREALIDYALSTRNEELFRHIMNGGEHEEPVEETAEETQSPEDFVRQIRLKAWI